MLNGPTWERLSSMRLTAMAEAWDEQSRDPKLQRLGFDERFGMLVDAEWLSRYNKRSERALRNAKLRISSASIEGIEHKQGRGIEKNRISQLASCRWIKESQNVIISGATGTGKTYLACALGHRACMNGYRVLYRRAPRLLEDLRLARASGDYVRELRKLSKVDLLIVDDWAIAPVQETERQDILEVLEDRHELRSTLLAGQLPPEQWHAYLGEATLADAICDRVLHAAHRFSLKGPSKRKEKAPTK